MGTEGYKPTKAEQTEAENRMSFYEAQASLWRNELTPEQKQMLADVDLDLEKSGGGFLKGKIKGQEVDLEWTAKLIEEGPYKDHTAFKGTVNGNEIPAEEATRIYEKYYPVVAYLKSQDIAKHDTINRTKEFVQDTSPKGWESL